MPSTLPAHAPASRTLAAIASIVLAVLAASCGDDPASPRPVTPVGAGVRIAPDRATVIVRDSITLTAAVDSLGDQRVTWRLGPTGTGLDLGELVVGPNNTAVYYAPTRVTSALDLAVQVTAVSVADSTYRATAVVTVPRIRITVLPGSLASVLPDTWVPHSVTVENTTVPGFTLEVIPTIPDPGTWTVTGPTSARYVAPSTVDVTATVELLARSIDDPQRFTTASVTLRRGYRVPSSKPALRKYAPEWDPSGARFAFVQGPPWELALHTVATGAEIKLADITWTGAEYDGRVTWSDDGTRLVFSEAASDGSRPLGYVSPDGTGRGVIAPASGDRYFEAAFVPNLGGGDSLLVAEWRGGGSALRVLSFESPLPGSGRVLYQAPAGDTLRWPDAATVSGFRAVAAARMHGDESEIVSLLEDGSGVTFPVSGPGRRTQVRWARQNTIAWITFLWDANHTLHRVRRIPDQPPARLYSEFFPEFGGDMVQDGSLDQHVLSRELPDGSVALYVVEFPPPSFTGVPAAEEMERARIGVPGALSLAQWRRWSSGTLPQWLWGSDGSGAARGR